MKIINLKNKTALYIYIKVNYGDYREIYETIMYGTIDEFEDDEQTEEEIIRDIISSFSPLDWVGYRAEITPLVTLAEDRITIVVTE